MCGRPLDEPTASRERRRVSVVFIDLVGFSDMTHDEDAELVRDLADEVLRAASRAIENEDGYVAALRGDGLMAVFGAPRSHPDDPERAVRAAAAALVAIERLGEARGRPLQGRAGVNTGTVIAGTVGAGRASEYTVMGSAVNLAARLEEAAEPGRVWVGDDTVKAARRLTFETTDPVHFAGFPEVTHAHRYVPSRDTRLAPFPSDVPFVGREREMALLQEARDQVASTGMAREVWLLGETGVGKTRLLRESFGLDTPTHALRGSTSARDAVTWLRAPLGDALAWKDLAGVVFDLPLRPAMPPLKEGSPHPAGGEGALSEEDVPRIEAGLRRLLPGEPRWWRAILASVHAIEVEPWHRIDRRRVNRTALAWRDLLAAWARDRGAPWIVIIDEAPPSALLDEFLALLREADAPILVVRSARSLPPGIAHEHRSTHVTLSPLPVDAADALVRALTAPELQEAASALVPQLDGIPGHLMELGFALSHAADALDASGDTPLDALLQARLDRLDGPTRRLLAHASLAGERVWDGLLHTLSGGRDGELMDTLLAERLLVREPRSQLTKQREYRFQSELLRRTARELIPLNERAPVHLTIATWLEAHAPLALSEAIGEHFLAGEAVEAAFAHWLAAADVAARTRTPEEADALYGRLLGLGVGVAERAHAALDWARACVERGDGVRATEALDLAERFVAEGRRDGPSKAHGLLDRVAQDASSLRLVDAKAPVLDETPNG